MNGLCTTTYESAFGFNGRNTCWCDSPFIHQRNFVNERDDGGNDNASGSSIPQCRTEETQRRAVVHWVLEDVEREGSDSVGHEDAKVIAEVGSYETRVCVSAGGK